MHLGAPRDEQARAALDRYKERIRPGDDTDRSKLLAQLRDVLDEEEIDNFNAALRRRSVVANNSGSLGALSAE